ncbi:succinylglutamate desuccinylase [Vibrio litoralis]|uniref:succinylglutamate desuccinylase n=1 Tax=Vibrio litoralis TaxID=335972 RepID=UPI00041CA057|nr:succinylglutamate desuccinylase [Vibrio litoralis]
MIQDFLALTLTQQIPQQCEGETNGFAWKWLAHGALLLEPLNQRESEDHIVISAGVHGNETAPIELLDSILSDLNSGDLVLNVRLLVLLGNPSAMAQGERYQQIDLNRLFSGVHNQYDACEETQRAAQLESLTKAFFAAPTTGKKWHLDLHTAIRESHHVRFAMLPFQKIDTFSRALFSWLESADIEAVVVNQAPSGTFSYFSSHHCGVNSCTLELGKAKPFGANDLSQFTRIDAALRNLITKGVQDCPESSGRNILVYQVSQQLTKLSDAFIMKFSDDVKNFTAFKQGEVLAVDGDTTYRVQQPTEWVLFPNPKVRPGLRAGLMLVAIDQDTIFQ